MSFYSQYIFPFFLDKIMSKPFFLKKRKEVLVDASGKILEIGVGTGLNFSYYPKSVQNITTLDVNEHMNAKGQQRADRAGIQVDHKVVTAEKLPFKNNTFDTVVSTWTLCSIPNVDQAVKEIYRVLQPGGRFIFIEHGISRNHVIIQKQQRWKTLWKVFGDGCHLDRDIKDIVERNQFILQSYSEYTAEGIIPLAAYTYQGVAKKQLYKAEKKLFSS